MKIRPIKERDAKSFLNLAKQLDSETEFMLFDKEERKTSVEEQRMKIKGIIHDPFSTIFVVEKDDRLIGYLGAMGNTAKRKRHSVYIAIGILQDWVGQGIGMQLFQELERWANEQHMHRLELTVMTSNEAGLALYKKAGFEVEGVKRDSMRVRDRYVDEYYMAKLIDQR
ncbi:GNAT family N-acetyltransferase [Pseudalkalibacillus berkeleyi]|uniref:GNAT family N-acetyltransferase n=1 Tax=Pseudalkalibacillus berkeleyi TaxID=1069813 RepID=A0ABS9GY97_9BACL|nr:GNAT family protein [Pseudalkalibacillus berkeleyi]MCF6136580.1 GNAT family N-acetyltransferase [Pseudalkalibacillus berkeleyi]